MVQGILLKSILIFTMLIRATDDLSDVQSDQIEVASDKSKWINLFNEIQRVNVLIE